MRNNKNIVKMALKTNVSVLKLASTDLKNDKKFILELIKDNP